MQKWEYIELIKRKGFGWKWQDENAYSDLKETGERLNRLGLDGWEVVGVTFDYDSYATYLLKRPILE
jgi:hypothetical protein